MLTTDQIRQKFLTFFESKEHTIVDSDSLVPKDDPTVLFTTAGMQQFKRQFLGYVDDYTRAATSQKCLRTDDLNEVGKTNFHHTFFEMLGNFSFGDYFKKDAIIWAWEFLTKEIKISPEKLWVTVYKDDTEAAEIWKNEIPQLDNNKIVPLGDKSNFWPADAKNKGPNGPCGPCSEIFFDFGVNPDCASKPCDPSCDCGRFSEIWNLVFTQFDRKDGGILTPLPNKNIDTGMGLERLASVLQGKRCNFEIDIFQPIIKAVDDNIAQKERELTKEEIYIITDHIRAIVIGIADGVVPSNEGRGYVIKKLIIDITDIAVQTGQKDSVIYKLVPSVIQVMKSAYPDLKTKIKEIEGNIQSVEKSYLKVRKERLPEFEKQILKIKKDSNPDSDLAENLGDLLFKYRDTYGLAINTIEACLSKNNISAETKEKTWKKFNTLLLKQQEQSRSGSKMTGDVFGENALDVNLSKSEFVGYSDLKTEAKILRIFVNNQIANEAGQGSTVKIVLDKTPFYAESGGQVGDSGELLFENGRVLITDTQKQNDVFIHSGVVETGILKTGSAVSAVIKNDRRRSIMRHHTATHLLQAALQQVLGPHIKQQGSLVNEDKLRFDFTHHQGLSGDELRKIELIVNQNILDCDSVKKEVMPIEKAKESGALAFFQEKYGKEVRVITIGDYSKEFCGGTHVHMTGEIGLFKIITESAIAQGIRRIEAIAGDALINYYHGQETILAEANKILKTSPDNFLERLLIQNTKLKKMEKENENLKLDLIKSEFSSDDKPKIINGIQIYPKLFMDIEMTLLRKISDFLKQKFPEAIIILGAKSKESASILIACPNAAVKKGLKADGLIKPAAETINGQGGGRSNMAQAGGKAPQNINAAIEQIINQIKEARLS